MQQGEQQATTAGSVVGRAPAPLDRGARVYIAGHRGLVGSAIHRHLAAQGFTRLLGVPSSELDLRDRTAVQRFFEANRPQVVVLAAARVGGIWANATHPADFLSDNLRIQTNVLDAAHDVDVERLLFLGSSCIYPRLAPQPIPESALLGGPLEPTNEAYAIAKIAGLLHVSAMRRQHGHRWISAMPTNLYGPGDTFDPARSHVLPAMIRRFHTARASGARTVTIWGTGTPRREFLHVDDLAAACLHLLDHYDDDVAINVGTGSDVSIRELAELIAEIVGWSGTMAFDPSKPDGTPRKLLDVSALDRLGWKAAVPLADGIAATYAWYLAHQAERGT
ncbi:MAG TPA: GDP-L-fucose synthase [Kineosporiaceae bacterium]